MISDIRIGLIGDENPEVTAHRAIPIALQIAAKQLDANVTHHWLPTNLARKILSDPTKPDFNGLWCVPASPYKDTEGALHALNKGRVENIPTLGSCGGFQHMAIEFARNELSYTHAENAEINPLAEMPLIAALSCSMVEATGHIDFIPDSLIAKHYQRNATDEKYRCNFGLNSDYSDIFDNTSLLISGVDENMDPRAIEHTNHPFYIGVAYQPERSALEDQSHPLISAFVHAAKTRKRALEQ